ncbi:MAG: hypothetical protein KGL39_57640 [Patescibacteria group bacterium]|nr:hypothetical protein [Patescibacteria group bacterium]
MAAFVRQAIDPSWPSMWEFVSEHGREFQFQPLPRGYRRMEPKACFENCWNLLKKRQTLTYCEGFASSRGIAFPVHHAWLVADDELVIEPTCDSFRDYFGVQFERDFVLSHKPWSSVLDNWREGWPLLKEKNLDGIVMEVSHV